MPTAQTSTIRTPADLPAGEPKTKRSTTTKPDPQNPSNEQSVPRSIARVLDLFEIVLAERSCNLTRAAAASGLTPTTALRYLRALEARGYITRDKAGDFSAGPTIHTLAESLRSETTLKRLTAIAQPHLDALAELTAESAYLALSDGTVATYVATAESSRAIRHVGWVGQNIPLEGSAVGAAFASPGTTANRTGAVEPDITAVSRALHAVDGINLAVSIVGPQHRFGSRQLKQHKTALEEAVMALSQELGTHGEDVSV